MKDVKLTPEGDIYPQTVYVEGVDYILQRVQIRLNTHLGEWILDTRQGLPWRRWLNTKPAPVDQVRDFVRREIEKTAGVTRVVDLTAEADNRAIKVSGDIITDSGVTVSGVDVDVDVKSGTARVLVPQFRGA